MRAFRISLGLLLLMGVLITLGTCYHRRVCRELTEQVSALSDTKEAAAQAMDLIEKFERHKRLLLPIIQRSLLRGVEDLLRDLATYAEYLPDRAGDFYVTRRRLLSAIGELERAGRAGFGLWL